MCWNGRPTAVTVSVRVMLRSLPHTGYLVQAYKELFRAILAAVRRHSFYGSGRLCGGSSLPVHLDQVTAAFLEIPQERPDGHDYLHRGSPSFSVSPPQSVIFIRDHNTLGQEVSGYIDYAHRLKSHDFEPYFNGKKRLLPGRSDLW